MKSPPGPPALIAVMVNVLLTACLLGAAAIVARRRFSPSGYRFAQTCFLLFLAVPLNSIRAVAAQYCSYLKSPLFELVGTRGVAALAVLLAAAGLAAALLFHRRAAPIAASAVAIFWPFCAVTFGQAIWRIAQGTPEGFAPKPLAAALPHAKPSPRVLWILADEWDYRLTFDNPAPGLRLPELEKLRRQALFAGQALPPGPETPISIPAYFTGRLVQEVRYDGPRELRISFQDASAPQRAAKWSEQPSIFSSARQLGFNTALVDWFHPTCRVLSGITSCDWWEMPLQFNSMGQTFWRILPNQTRSLFETTLFSPFGQSLAVRQHVETYRAILERGLAVATNPEYGFAFIHLPVPHAPHAYDRRTGQFTLKNSPIRGYFESLALLDRTLGDIRRSMQAAGMWDKTTVLITSDHPYREADLVDGRKDPRIPYLLKMASQKEGSVYPQPFNTVLTHDLVLSILNGETANDAGVARWLDRNRSRFPMN